MAVEDKKIVVLIVDEGQKIRVECLELLRELLNYETNDRKLLQIIIFAQNEFRDTFSKLPNFADRINECIELKSLDFAQTRALIRYRLDKASASYATRDMFTFGGFLAIYLSTRGYPRKIMKLCHKTFLALVLRNGRRVTWPLVRACASDKTIGAALGWQHIAAAGAGLLVTAAALFWLAVGSPGGGARNPAGPSTSAGENAAAVALQAERLSPRYLGSLKVSDSGQVKDMLEAVYGGDCEDCLDYLAKANPEIVDISNPGPDSMLRLPIIESRTVDTAPDGFMIQVTEQDRLDSAYATMKRISEGKGEFRILPHWNGQGELSFSLVLKRSFPTEGGALLALSQLDENVRRRARIIKDWERGAVFLSSGDIAAAAPTPARSPELYP